jgi:hypothetical protein
MVLYDTGSIAVPLRQLLRHFGGAGQSFFRRVQFSDVAFFFFGSLTVVTAELSLINL